MDFEEQCLITLRKWPPDTLLNWSKERCWIIFPMGFTESTTPCMASNKLDMNQAPALPLFLRLCLRPWTSTIPGTTAAHGTTVLGTRVSCVSFCSFFLGRRHFVCSHSRAFCWLPGLQAAAVRRTPGGASGQLGKWSNDTSLHSAFSVGSRIK